MCLCVCVEWSPRFLGRCWSAECVVPYGERETDYYAQLLSVCAVLGEPLQPDDDRCHELPFLWAKGESPEMGHTIVKPWKSSSSSRQDIHKINKFCVCIVVFVLIFHVGKAYVVCMCVCMCDVSSIRKCSPQCHS